MSTEPIIEYPKNPDKLVAEYLLKNRGASANEIMQYLRGELNSEAQDLDKIVETILENCTALGFLERKDIKLPIASPPCLKWLAREASSNKRGRSSSRRRRRRVIRRKRTNYRRRCKMS